jgi:hypothetical protein
VTDLTVLVPTRGRPANALRLLEAMQKLNRAETQLVFGVDADDPELDAYRELSLPLKVVEPMGPGMVGALNQLAARYDTMTAYLGFMGDDHLPRTEGWDSALCAALDQQGGGVAYGNDLVHGPNLATAVAMDARIPRNLGYMAPPNLQHLYVDNVWLDWGRGLGKLMYLHDVIIEHLHPLVGKAEQDERYEAVNNSAMFERDRLAYEDYKAHGLGLDIANLQARA